MQPTPEDKLLLSVVKLQPSAIELENINALISQINDWEGFTNQLIAHGSAPLFYKKLALLSNANLIPAEVQSKLQQAYYKTLSRSMLLYQAFGEVVQALQQEGIEPMVLKGAYLSEHLYGDIALRQFSDLDILVPVADGLRSLEVLEAIGFKPRKSKPISKFVAEHSDFVHYAPMERDEISVEVHIKLHSRSGAYELSIPDIWSRATPVHIHKQKVKVQSMEDLLMHLCIHADKHFSKGEIQLKCFNDIVNLLEQLKTDFDWERFEAMCQQYRCEEVVFKYFVLLVRFYQAYLPPELYHKYEYCVDADVESRFVGYLHGERYEEHGTQSAVPGHINSLRNIKNPWTFAVYIKEVLFPSKAFMMDKYMSQLIVNNEELIIKDKTVKYKLLIKCWWLWYVYRWGVGVKGMIQLIINNSMSLS